MEVARLPSGRRPGPTRGRASPPHSVVRDDQASLRVPRRPQPGLDLGPRQLRVRNPRGASTCPAPLLARVPGIKEHMARPPLGAGGARRGQGRDSAGSLESFPEKLRKGPPRPRPGVRARSRATQVAGAAASAAAHPLRPRPARAPGGGSRPTPAGLHPPGPERRCLAPSPPPLFCCCCCFPTLAECDLTPFQKKFDIVLQHFRIPPRLQRLQPPPSAFCLCSLSSHSMKSFMSLSRKPCQTPPGSPPARRGGRPPPRDRDSRVCAYADAPAHIRPRAPGTSAPPSPRLPWARVCVCARLNCKAFSRKRKLGA